MTDPAVGPATFSTAPYWDAALEGVPERPVLDGVHDAAVVIVGAGVAGLLTGLLAQEAGLSVAIVERARLGGGTTGASTAKVTALHGATYEQLSSRSGGLVAGQYANANQAGLEEIDRIVREHSIDCDWERLPAFTIAFGEDDAGTIEREAAAAAAAGLPVTLTTTTGLPLSVAAAVRCENQAQLHPRRFALGCAAAFERAGGVLFEQSPVAAVDAEARAVRAASGEVRAAQVVVATQLPIYDPGGLFAQAEPVRSYAMAAVVETPVPPEMHLSVDEPSRSVRPAGPDRSVGIFGGGGHRVGTVAETHLQHEDLQRWVAEHFGIREVLGRWSAQDWVPIDGRPFIGRMPRAPEGVFVATGFKKWGFTSAAVAALVLVDQLRGQQGPWDETFDAARGIENLAAAKEAVRDNAEVGKHFVADRLRRPRALDDLQPGEGAIVVRDGRRVAAHRDLSGRVHARDATCTHLGCEVTWNTAEQSWDCPCHGSRFGPDGRVLSAPAVRPLDPT